MNLKIPGHCYSSVFIRTSQPFLAYKDKRKIVAGYKDFSIQFMDIIEAKETSQHTCQVGILRGSIASRKRKLKFNCLSAKYFQFRNEIQIFRILILPGTFKNLLFLKHLSSLTAFYAFRLRKIVHLKKQRPVLLLLHKPLLFHQDKLYSYYRLLRPGVQKNGH